MKPSASGFGFAGAAGCKGAPPEGNAGQSVRSDGDRSFGFWPRTTSRGSACAGESAQAVASLRDLVLEEAQAVAVTVRPRWFEPKATADCAGGAAQAVVFSRRSASDLFFGSLSGTSSSSGSSSGSSSLSGSFSKSETLTACAGGTAQAVVSLRDVDLGEVEQAVLSLGDDDFEEVERDVTNSSRAFSASSSDPSSDSSSASESSSSSLSYSSSVTLEACADDFAQEVASLRGA